MTAALILTASPPAYLCVHCNAPWRPSAERCAECERRAANTPEAQVADLRAQLAAVTAERDRWRSTAEGRGAPPSDAEIDAHIGYWRWYGGGEGRDGLDGAEARRWREKMHLWTCSVRWWPIDRYGVPCAWPTAAAVVLTDDRPDDDPLYGREHGCACPSCLMPENHCPCAVCVEGRAAHAEGRAPDFNALLPTVTL